MVRLNERALLTLALDVSSLYLVLGKRGPEWLRFLVLGITVYNISNSARNLIVQQNIDQNTLQGLNCCCNQTKV